MSFTSETNATSCHQICRTLVNKTMPPEVTASPAFANPQTRPPLLPRSELNLADGHKDRQLKRMEITITRKRLIHILVFVLACMSIFRLLRFAITSYYSSPRSSWPGLSETCNISDSNCMQVSSHTSSYSLSPKSKPITKKEYRFLSNIISKRAPCNLLVFGWEPQYRHLAKINAGGTTVFLEDAPERIKRMKRSNSTRIYKVSYDATANEAYNLLTHAREEIACAPNTGSLETSNCKLALTKLPNEIYTRKWDMILVDGPSSDGPEAPGRMAAIYTSSMIARAGNITTNVVVHDVDRTIEKWFSREFLCEQNLVLSKGRFWNFRIKGGKKSKATGFCS